MICASTRRAVRVGLMAGLLLLGLVAGRASADVCVTIDESRDTFTPSERTAALLLLTRQFELAGERVVAPGCPMPYVVSHVQLGTLISITLSGPNGQRDATARVMEDVPAVYSQMVRSLLRGQPMEAPGIVDRTNVTDRQAAPANRVYSDSLFYARLGYGGVVGDRTYAGPSVGFFGYRREFDAFGIDVSFFNLLFKSSDRTYGYGPSGSSGQTGSWLKLEFLRFATPLSGRSAYFGGGLSLTTVNVQNGYQNWDGNGLQGELTAGYEMGRTSTIRVFFQFDAGLPFYKLSSATYLPVPPYTNTTSTEHRWAPSFTASMGLGWQRGGK
jgi:hypothetical protein